MVKINVVVRELGKLKPDYSLDFDLPEVPAIGSYMSVQRPDNQEPFGEDLIVRKVWWRLKHPETAGSAPRRRKLGHSPKSSWNVILPLAPIPATTGVVLLKARKVEG